MHLQFFIRVLWIRIGFGFLADPERDSGKKVRSESGKIGQIRNTAQNMGYFQWKLAKVKNFKYSTH